MLTCRAVVHLNSRVGGRASQAAISTSLNDAVATLDDLNDLEDRFIQNVRTHSAEQRCRSVRYRRSSLTLSSLVGEVCSRASVDRWHHPSHQELCRIPRIEVY